MNSNGEKLTNEALPLLFRGSQEQKIGWNDFITGKMDNITHSDFGEQNPDITIFLGTVNAAGGVVYPLVRLPPPMVLEGILDGRHAQNKDDRDHGHFLAESTHGRDPIEQDDEEEVEVCETVELLQEVLGDEGKRSVLGCPDGIVRISPIWMIFGSCARRNDMVGHDRPHPRQFWGFRLPPKEESVHPGHSGLPDGVDRFRPRCLP